MYQIDKTTQLSSPAQALEQKEHVIAVDDELMLYVCVNNAEELLSPILSEASATFQQNISYRVLKDGNVFLPGIGNVFIAGKTISEAEALLRGKYTSLLNEPFIKLQVINKRVYVHQAGKGSTVSVDVSNPNTTLIDVLSTAGGISEGKAYEIYLIRSYDGMNRIYNIDLSKYENIQYSYIVMQSKDIIYVTPKIFVAQRILEDMTPLLSIFNTILLIYNLTKSP